MFGSRKRIGYIGPTVMEVVPYEFYRFAPDGIGLVGVTCNIDDWSQDYFDQALAQVTTAATYLGSGGVPATTGVRAAMTALRHFGARRVVIASPYPERHNSAMAGYLAAHGFDIVRAEGLDVPFKKLQEVEPATIKHFATDVLARAGGCDALYLPCPQWQAAQVVAELESECGVPAVAYTHASFFTAFKTLGIKDAIRGHGWLLASLAETK